MNSEMPSSPKSFSRNWPGFADSAGKPPASDSPTPGVVKKKDKVVRKVMTPIAPPTADASGKTKPVSRSTPVEISNTPSMLLVP